VAELGHPVQDDVASGERPVRVACGVVGSGGLHEPGQGRRLWQRQRRRRHAEEVPGCGLDAVRSVPEVGDVQVPLEDLVLGVPLLDRDRVPQLLQLAAVVDRPCCGDRGGVRLGMRLLHEHVLDVLLGQCRPSLDLAPGPVAHKGAGGAAQVEPRVLVEPGVLDVHDGLTHRRRHLCQGDVDAVLEVEGRDEVALGVEDAGLLRQLGDLEVSRQGLERLHARACDERAAPDDGQGEAGDEQPGQPGQPHQQRDAPEHRGQGTRTGRGHAGQGTQLARMITRTGSTWVGRLSPVGPDDIGSNGPCCPMHTDPYCQ